MVPLDETKMVPLDETKNSLPYSLREHKSEFDHS